MQYSIPHTLRALASTTAAPPSGSNLIDCVSWRVVWGSRQMRLHWLENALKECHKRLQTARMTAACKQALTNRLMTWQHDMTITSADMQDLKCCKSYLSPPLLLDNRHRLSTAAGRNIYSNIDASNKHGCSIINAVNNQHMQALQNVVTTCSIRCLHESETDSQQVVASTIAKTNMLWYLECAHRRSPECCASCITSQYSYIHRASDLLNRDAWPLRLSLLLQHVSHFCQCI